MPRLFLAFIILTTGVGLAQPSAELWVQTAAEYRANCLQTYALATAQLDRVAAGLQRDAEGRLFVVSPVSGQKLRAAVIMDLDETVLDNSGLEAYLTRSGEEYSDQAWTDWVEFQGRTPAAQRSVPGAVPFIGRAQQLGFQMVFLSNRSVHSEEATRSTLAGLGLDDYELLLRLDKAQEQVAAERMATDLQLPAAVLVQDQSHKEVRRREAARDHFIAMLLGDDLGDFLAFVKPADADPVAARAEAAYAHQQNWGRTWFILPNPMYGHWGPGATLPAENPERYLNDFGFGPSRR